jgi:DNA-binding response OmpR family regulator
VSGERILVVDDGADMREFVIQYVLRPNGYNYLEARDGLEALDQITANAPDLIVLDLQMPRLDGIGLLQRMKEGGISIPVVLMTFYGSEEIAIEVFRLGVRDYVIKPFTEEELLAAIERGLTEVRLRRQRDVLRRVGKFMAGLPEADTLLLYILEAAAELTGVSQGAILLLSDNGQGLVNRAVMVKGQSNLSNQPVQNALAWQAVETGRSTAGQAQPDQASGHSLMPVYVPMIVGNTCFGVLYAVLIADVITEEQYNLLESLVDYASIGFERARLAALTAQ